MFLWSSYFALLVLPYCARGITHEAFWLHVGTTERKDQAWCDKHIFFIVILPVHIFVVMLVDRHFFYMILLWSHELSVYLFTLSPVMLWFDVTLVFFLTCCHHWCSIGCKMAIVNSVNTSEFSLWNWRLV